MELDAELGIVLDSFPPLKKERDIVLGAWVTYFEEPTRHEAALDVIDAATPTQEPDWYQSAGSCSGLTALLHLTGHRSRLWAQPVPIRVRVGFAALKQRVGERLPLDIALDIDLHSIIELPASPSAASVCYRPCVYAGSGSVQISKLILAAGEGTTPRFDIEMRACTERMRRATAILRIVRFELDHRMHLMSPLDSPLHHRRDEARRLLKLHKQAVMAPYVLSSRAPGAFAARYPVVARSHVPRWITSWESIPTELFFTLFHDREPCYTFPEEFLVALMREALFLLNEDELELAAIAERQFSATRRTESLDADFHRVVVVLCRTVSSVVHAMPYLPDGYYDAKGVLHSVDNFWDAWRTLSCDCEDCTRAIHQLLRGLQVLPEPVNNPLLRMLQRTAALYVPIACLGNATSVSATAGAAAAAAASNNDNPNSMCLHSWLVLDPVIRFEERANRVLGKDALRMPRASRAASEWERSLESCFVEGTGRIHPYLRPAKEYLSGQPLAAYRRAIEIRLSAFASFQEAWNQVRPQHAPHRLLTFLVPEMVQSDHDYAGPGPQHTGEENISRLFPFYRTLVDGYTDVLLQQGGRLGRWTYVKLCGTEWTYPISVEEFLYRDPDVGMVFSMPLSDDVLRASRVVLEHTARTRNPETLLAPRLHRPSEPESGLPDRQPFSPFYDELETALSHLPRAALPALGRPYRPPTSSREVQYVDLFWNPDYGTVPAASIRAWCDALQKQAWLQGISVLRRKLAPRLEYFLIRVAVNLQRARLSEPTV